MNKSGVWKSLESKPAEADEGEPSQPVSKAATPDEGIVIKVRQWDSCEDNWELVHINEKTLLFYQVRLVFDKNLPQRWCYQLFDNISSIFRSTRIS